ncbi:MAG: hypothetical protein J6Z11_12870 [Candidatus Riflebacteria bacterium]|nr:hypothetical protein [Candidatus Riflebacteria bacterium]
MQENILKSKHILFKYQTIEELIQGTGYKPSFKALAVISPNMTVDELIKQLLGINEISLACEVMVYALHPRARIWWGCSIIKSLHEELFAKSDGKEGAKTEGEAEEKATKEKAEAVVLPKNKEEAKEMLSQKVNEQKEALGLPQDKKEEQSDDASNASSGDSKEKELTPEQKKELIEKLKAQQEQQRAEQKAKFEKDMEMAEKKKQEALKSIDEAIAGLSPEDKAFYDECQTKIDQYFRENVGMTKQELMDFAKDIIKKAEKADASGDQAERQAVLSEFASVLSKNSDNIAKKFDEIIAIQKEFELNQGKNSSKSKVNTADKKENPKEDENTKSDENAKTEETADAKEKPEIDLATLKIEKEEAEKAKKIKEVEEKAANIENNLRKKAYEAAVAWVKEPSKPNTLNAEKYSKEAGNYPEGMLCLASFWSYGDFSISSASQKKDKDEGKPEQPDMVLRVDPCLPPKGIYSTLLMSALHEGGTRKPVERFVLYYQMGEKIACGEDNWAKENVDLKQEQPAAVPEKSENKSKEKPEEKPRKKTETDDTPSYTKWKM